MNLISQPSQASQLPSGSWRRGCLLLKEPTRHFKKRMTGFWFLGVDKMRRCGKLNTWCEQHQQSLESLNWDQNRRGEPRNRRRRFLEIRATNDRYTIQQILNGRLAQWKSRTFTRSRPEVQILYRLPFFWLTNQTVTSVTVAYVLWEHGETVQFCRGRPFYWAYDVIGSHASLRSSWRNPWGFKSLYAHHL